MNKKGHSKRRGVKNEMYDLIWYKYIIKKAYTSSADKMQIFFLKFWKMYWLLLSGLLDNDGKIRAPSIFREGRKE
jgi:hypothetical protein